MTTDAADELKDVGQGELGTLDIVGRVRLLKAPCAILSSAGQLPSAHVYRQVRLCDHGDCWVCKCETCPMRGETRYPCSPTCTCTRDDAAKPGHPERVKERSDAFATAGADDVLPVGAKVVGRVLRPEDAEAYEEGVEALRAACWDAVQRELVKFGITRDEPMYVGMKSAIEGATP